MADLTAHELVLALQNNPEVLRETLIELSLTTACKWEQLGRLHFRRTVQGDVVGWVREPWLPKQASVTFGITARAGQLSTHHPQQPIDLHNTTEVSSWGEARAKVDWHLERRYWHLSELDPRLPVSEALVASAAGLARQDQFQLSQMLQTLTDPQLAPSLAHVPEILLRQGGGSTQVAVKALHGILTGRRVRVLVRDRQRQDHWIALFETLVGSVGLPDLLQRHLDKFYRRMQAGEPECLWVLTALAFSKVDRRDLWPDRMLFLHDLS